MAAIADLTVRVAVAAAVASTVSGSQVLRAVLIVPLRTRRAEDATALVFMGAGEDAFHRGSALQIAPGLWIRACAVVREGPR